MKLQRFVKISFQISTLKFFSCKTKKIKFGTKIDVFGYFLAGILKAAPQICGIARYYLNKKTLNLGSKMPYLGIFRSKFEKTIDIFEMSFLEFF